MNIRTGSDLARACVNVAENYRTLYVMGCFGAPLNASTKPRYTQNHEYNRRPERTVKINAAPSGTFGFDCVCLIKGLMWGWEGDTSRTYGGATYASNGVSDVGADRMIQLCSHISSDFSTILVGEAVWMEGHIGVYIGDGLAVESTPVWKDGVQITAVHNIGKKVGYNGRKWIKHGRLPFINYEQEETSMAKFKDVEKSAWYADAVEYVSDHGLMNGTGENKFEPEEPMTRAEVAAVITRLHKQLAEK